MLEHVRQNAIKAGLRNIETVECAAEDLDETQPLFDASISRLGLMLFSAPRSALKAIHRVLKPNARFAALVFTSPAKNPFLAQPMAILLRHAGKSAPAPGQPGLFALGGDGILEKLMRESGLEDVQTKTIRAPLRLPSVSTALEMMQQAFGAFRAVVADIGDEERSKAWAEVYDCLKQFGKSTGFEAEFEFVIGSAAKSS
jgi:SAM-dependent methyltransferase